MQDQEPGALAQDPPEMQTPPGRPSRLPRWFKNPAIACLLPVVVALLWSYAPEARGLVETWNRDPNYSHGYLVIPLALAILWRRLKSAGALELIPWPPAWGVLAFVLAVRVVFHQRGNQWGEVVTLLPVLACLTLTFGGWRLLRRVWPAIAYLVFMLPMPAKLDSALAQPLQRLATNVSHGVLQLTGLWVISEGNVIHVGADRLEVANACNGLSIVLTLTATVTALILLLPIRPWKQIVLLASALPIALASNVARIVATAWCYHWYGGTVGEKFAHDLAGWLMMPVALLAVSLELLLLNWLVIEEETFEEPTLLGRPIPKTRLAVSDQQPKPETPNGH